LSLAGKSRGSEFIVTSLLELKTVKEQREKCCETFHVANTIINTMRSAKSKKELLFQSRVILKHPLKDAARDLASVLAYMYRFPVGNYGEGKTLKDFTIGPFVLIEQWGKLNFEYRNRITKLLEKYYKTNAPVDYGARIILKRVGVFGSFLVINHDSDIMDLLGSKDQKTKLNSHRKEFKQFALFLRSKFGRN
jgi:hypothetical protein